MPSARPLDDAHLLAALGVPDADVAVGRGGDDPLAVRAEGDAVDLRLLVVPSHRATCSFVSRFQT